jgi:diacylglycerol O-acyltransferase / wax synthase
MQLGSAVTKTYSCVGIDECSAGGGGIESSSARGHTVQRLTGSDAMMLYAEAANVPMHTVKVAIVEAPDAGGFSVDTVRKVLLRRLHRFEPMRRVLVDTPYAFHRPMWRENCPVDLTYHVRPLHLPAPGGRRELDNAVAKLIEEPLDRTRPLWEIYVVDGLADGRFAVVTKIHHALADGVASANLLAGAVDRPESIDARELDALPTRTRLLWAATRDHVRQITELPGLVRYTAAGLRRVRRSRRSQDAVESIKAPKSFMNHRLTSGRQFATASIPFGEAKRVTRELGCTINDLVLAMSAGAARELRLRYDGNSDARLVAMVPVCLDASQGRSAGNNFTQMAVALPADIDDPLHRVKHSHDAAIAAKQVHTLQGPELWTRWFAYMPPGLARMLSGWMARSNSHNKMQNLIISNVPGPREFVAVAGARVAEFYSVGPLVAGSGLNITVWSYADQLNISVLTDAATLSDAHEVTDAMIYEFSEIRSAAGILDNLQANVA